MPYMVIGNTGVTPSVGFGYRFKYGRNRLDWDASFSMRKAVGNEYTVTQASSSTEHAQAYIPYLIRGEEKWSIKASLIAAHTLKHGEIGVNASAGYARRTSAPYREEYAVPVCGSRDERLVSVCVFYAF